MAVAAEQIEYFPSIAFDEAQSLPQIVVVPDMLSDEFTRRRAERFIDTLGSVAVVHEVELSSEPESEAAKISSLKDAVHLAANGDPTGRAVLKASAATDVVERTMKVEQVMEVEMEVDDNGDIHQYGQTTEQIQENSWRYAAHRWQMRERIKAENNNAFRIKEHYHNNLLHDSSFVEISRAADNMDDKTMQKEGFFTDTMSCVIRVTTVKNGVLTVESAFVAGVKELGAERHDEQTIIKMGQALGVDFTGKTTADIIDTPLLIPNSLMPNGVVDLVKLYDICAEGTFFGQAKPQRDYLAVIAESQQRELTFADKVEAIVDELIAHAPHIKTPVDAAKLLNKISGAHMVDRAVEDPSINPRVFGEEAAAYIITARHHQEMGNYELAQAATRRAKKVETSGSCPGSFIDAEREVDLYGNAIGDPESSANKTWHGGKIYKNAKCRGCHKVKQEVGACHICKDCVGKPTELKRSYEQQQQQERAAPKSEATVVVSFDKKLKAKQDRARKLGHEIVAVAA